VSLIAVTVMFVAWWLGPGFSALLALSVVAVTVVAVTMVAGTVCINGRCGASDI
jgi:hypothetical protein